MNKPRTDEEIVAQTEELAKTLALEDGWVRKSPRRWHESENPRTRKYWRMACIAQEILTNTDVENAVANIRPDTHD
jgi:hypothetical protein